MSRPAIWFDAASSASLPASWSSVTSFSCAQFVVGPPELQTPEKLSLLLFPPTVSPAAASRPAIWFTTSTSASLSSWTTSTAFRWVQFVVSPPELQTPAKLFALCVVAESRAVVAVAPRDLVDRFDVRLARVVLDERDLVLLRAVRRRAARVAQTRKAVLAVVAAFRRDGVRVATADLVDRFDVGLAAAVLLELDAVLLRAVRRWPARVADAREAVGRVVASVGSALGGVAPRNLIDGRDVGVARTRLDDLDRVLLRAVRRRPACVADAREVRTALVATDACSCVRVAAADLVDRLDVSVVPAAGLDDRDRVLLRAVRRGAARVADARGVLTALRRALSDVSPRDPIDGFDLGEVRDVSRCVGRRSLLDDRDRVPLRTARRCTVRVAYVGVVRDLVRLDDRRVVPSGDVAAGRHGIRGLVDARLVASRAGTRVVRQVDREVVRCTSAPAVRGNGVSALRDVCRLLDV